MLMESVQNKSSSIAHSKALSQIINHHQPPTTKTSNMKFAIAVVFTLALAMGVQSSVIPLISQIAGHGLSWTAVSNPAVVAAPWLPAHAPAAITVGAWPPAVHAPAIVTAAHGAAVVAAHAPSVVVAPVAHEGVYTAQTRGAVHTAPLAGHLQSVASINAAPAPGTL